MHVATRRLAIFSDTILLKSVTSLLEVLNQVWNQGALNVGLRLESRYVRTASMLLFTLNQALNLESLCSTHTAKSL